MGRTNVVGAAGSDNRSPASPRAEDLILTHLGSLDLRGMRTRVEHIDGDPVLFVDDGDVEIEFSSGMGGNRGEAVRGAERLAATVAAYAVELRRRGA